jgi:hypothetical protein
MALHQIEMGNMGLGDIVDAGIAGNVGHKVIADAFEDSLDFPGISADIVLTEHIDGILGGCPFLGTDDMADQSVIGDMVSARLADALIALAAEGYDLTPVRPLCLGSHGMDIVTDKTTGQVEQIMMAAGSNISTNLLDSLLSFFSPRKQCRAPAYRWRNSIHKVLGIFVAPGLVAPRSQE